MNTGYQAFIKVDGADDPPIVVDGETGPVPFTEYVRSLAEYKASSRL